MNSEIINTKAKILNLGYELNAKERQDLKDQVEENFNQFLLRRSPVGTVTLLKVRVFYNIVSVKLEYSDNIIDFDPKMFTFNLLEEINNSDYLREVEISGAHHKLSSFTIMTYEDISKITDKSREILRSLGQKDLEEKKSKNRQEIVYRPRQNIEMTKEYKSQDFSPRIRPSNQTSFIDQKRVSYSYKKDDNDVYTIYQLKRFLKERGLKQTGNKDELVERLRRHL